MRDASAYRVPAQTWAVIDRATGRVLSYHRTAAAAWIAERDGCTVRQLRRKVRAGESWESLEVK